MYLLVLEVETTIVITFLFLIKQYEVYCMKNYKLPKIWTMRRRKNALFGVGALYSPKAMSNRLGFCELRK
jgi:hypothetical protein